MPVQTALGVAIKARRIELGWTQEELAERISAGGEYVRQSEISRIENGRIALPRRERLERLAIALDLPLGELLARSGWAGARTSFDQHAPVAAVQPHSVPESSASSLERADDERITHGVPGGDAEWGVSVEAGNGDAVRALRRALSRMRTESERLSRNRQHAIALGRQVDAQHEREAHTTWAGDYPEATGS